MRVMRLSDLKPASYNPRKITPDASLGLSASLKRFGLVQPIVVNKRTANTIVGGHQRYDVLRAQGHEEAAVIVVDLDETQERALNITLNNPHVEGVFTDSLQALLEQLRNEDPLMLSELHLGKLLDSLYDVGAKEGHTDPDSVPETPEKPVTKPGNVWRMGRHRLMCGSSTKPADVDALMDIGPAAMIFTDPPWNVAIGKDSNPRHRQREGLENDDLVGCGEWPAIDFTLRAAKMHWSSTIVWVKDVFVLGRSNYHRRFEPIWYGWPEGSKSSFNGARDLDDVWEINRPKVSKDHPTMKPVELVARAINHSSTSGQIVFDPFTGAGSALLACEQFGRVFRGMEIDPRFCDVIVRRWELFTGQKAQLEDLTSKEK